MLEDEKTKDREKAGEGDGMKILMELGESKAKLVKRAG